MRSADCSHLMQRGANCNGSFGTHSWMVGRESTPGVLCGDTSSKPKYRTNGWVYRTRSAMCRGSISSSWTPPIVRSFLSDASDGGGWFGVVWGSNIPSEDAVGSTPWMAAVPPHLTWVQLDDPIDRAFLSFSTTREPNIEGTRKEGTVENMGLVLNHHESSDHVEWLRHTLLEPNQSCR